MSYRLSPCSLVYALLAAVAVAGCGASEKQDKRPQGSAGEASRPAAGGGAAGAAGGAQGGGSGGAAGAPDSSGGGESGGDGSGGAAGAVGDLLVDDFEDGDDEPLLAGGWYLYTDENNGGGSTLTFAGADDGSIEMTGAGFESERSLEVDYAFEQADLPYEPFVGVGVWIASEDDPLDLSQYAGLSYTYRGGAHTVRVETTDVADYDFHVVPMQASTAWTTVEVRFDELGQEGWGTAVDFDPAHVRALSFQLRGSSGESGTLQLDNLTVVRLLADAGPDMSVRDPQPPADEEIESIELSNPLQGKAMQQLNRGYNITNWLEQDRFDGFTYDQEFVAALAAAGFQSLRLPIDLDLYVEERSGSGDGPELVLHDDLFTILDAFDEWTQEHGLSLTIDYHQYDHSFDVTVPDSVAEAVQLWSLVAEHFAASPREDLFYELLNEPELAAADTAPTPSEWTAIAEEMLAAIRAHDDTHTVIFGDVEWYGIGALVDREPLSDPNVVYAFHFYDPFIFTHQGASWTDMATTHDIPYPYSADRWSEYYADLGFSRFNEAWILSQAKNYYRQGHRSALRNRILEAKRWAVEYDVPVICNEFGVYDQASRLEDRVRYYTDLIEIFAELEIPWQHWFMIMDASGDVIPEYEAAFQLNE